MKKPSGYTLDDLSKILGWKNNSIRGVLSNLQKDLQFTLLNIEISKPNPKYKKGDKIEKPFLKETRYIIKDADYELDNLLINNNDVINEEEEVINQ